MQQQQPPSQQSNNMLTSLDKIPQKPSNNSIDDMSDDPIVKDVLSEFEKELLISEQQVNNTNNYNIKPK